MCAILTLDEMPSMLSSESKLHKDYYRKGSVEKISGRGSQGGWRQGELLGGKLPIVK
jgi:hypothetical protein